ncbi:FxSxx-COOH system tetratricopeptide repeat protein [Umezawaea sp. NPDC059074]|uniref:FxSxx-COOH system tetratricopeptide repeat protein n=1 Tax=Umezawaea sp. NPDC059074 TaxID=3346716 RepID=UPI0036C2F8A7
MTGDRVVQDADAAGQAKVLQAGRDLTWVEGDLVTGSSVPVMESITSTPALNRIPAGPRQFVGRTTELERLERAVTASGRAVVVAVHGLGGVGKSTVASRFAALTEDRYTLAWWISADSPAAIDAGLAALTTTLAPQTADLPSEQRAELAVRWLATHQDWLLVLDNLTTPADATGLLDRVRTGTIVITSRQATGWRGIDTISLDVLTPAEALDLLTRVVRTDWPTADLTDADRLCEEVGRLPLAVEQAAAYLAQTRITPTAYLDLLAHYPAKMFTATAEGTDAHRTMARVWHVTLDALTTTPLAGDLLRRLAWCAPDTIPRHLVATADPDTVHALGRLAAYSMITLDADAISVHRLVQAVTRTPDPTDPHRLPTDIAQACATTAAALSTALAKADPRLPADWPAFHTVLPHARALLDHTPPDADVGAHCDLADHVGLYLDDQGDTTSAITLHTRAADGRHRLHGPDHPATLTSRNNLAHAYRAAGDLARAISLYAAALADSERVLGPNHPSTLTSRSNLAEAHQSAGDFARAIPLHESILAERERVLGPDHLSTLISRTNLANAYESAGDLTRAIPLQEATLTDCERVLGLDHPLTLGSRNNLAGAYESAGDLTRAIPLYEAVLADRQRVLGPDHPDTLGSRNNVAYSQWAAGDLDRAIPLLEAALAECVRALGPDHPFSLSARNNLASGYESAGDLGRAIPLHEAVVADRERVLGPHHPHTLGSRNNLASAYWSAGDLSRAVRLFEATLDDAERVLGPDHRLTRTIRSNIENAPTQPGSGTAES